MNVRIHRAEVQRGAAFGVVLGRDDKARDVYALLSQGEVREIAHRIDEEGQVVSVDLPASIVRRLADFLSETSPL